MVRRMELTLLMPCLNEAETLALCVRRARETLERLGVEGEVLVADNGSTDGSQALAESLGARVVAVAERGYGAALRGGIEAARGRFIIMADADASYDFGESGRFLEKLRAGADLVMGCRLPAGGGTIRPGAMPWLNRWIGNPVLTFIGRLLFRCPSHDFHSGMRGFRKEAIQRLGLRTPGMEFASEMVVKAALYGLAMDEVPVTLSKDGRSRPPHLRRWRDGWRHLRFMLLFSPRWLFFYPGLAGMAVGGAVFGRLWLGGPMDVGDITLDVHTLEVAALVLGIGLQMVLFAAFVRIYVHTRGLLPGNRFLARAFAWFNMERGLLAGGGVLVFGLALLAVRAAHWAMGGFGDLNTAETLRGVIAGRTFVSMGVQVMLFSLVFSYLGLGAEPDDGRKSG